MIISKLIGGLGNQMFQYAAGLSLAKRTNQKLKLDISSFDQYDLRDFQLNFFSGNFEIATSSDLDYFTKKVILNPLSLFNDVIGIKKNNKNRVFKESFFHFDTNFLSLSGSVYLTGYWQSEKYFENVKKEVLNDFSLSSPISLASKYFEFKILNTTSISLHVRRGDYVSNSEVNQFHGICSLDYYKKSVNYFLEIFPSAVFFIFSDDIVWCEENFSFIDSPQFVKFNSSVSNLEELHLMSICKHNIIANSSFSWWGAWLNQNSDKIVISPKKWFNDESIITSDIIPSNWIRL